MHILPVRHQTLMLRTRLKRRPPLGRRRGYKGRVVSATETHCRIELEAQYKTVTVKRSDLKLEGDGAAAGNRTPSSPWDTPTTPMHPGAPSPLLKHCRDSTS